MSDTSSTVHVLNPSKFDEVESANITPVIFDPKNGEKGKVTFTLTEPGIVRVFLRPQERRFVLLKTFIDFETKEAGTCELTWDGYDRSGNLLDPSKYRITIQAQPLRHSVSEEDLPWDPDPHLREEKVLNFTDRNKRIHAHCVHPKEKCGELKVKILSPKPGETVKDKVKVVREVSEETRRYGREDGHSARYYVDYMILKENKEEKERVSEWLWDTSDIPAGKHVLTATACDHHDHMGSDSVVVNVER